jgi:hypothetical protein
MVGTEGGGTQGLAVAPATTIITGLVGLGMGPGPVHDMERRPEPSHREGARDCSVFLATAEVTKRPHGDALAPLIARRTGRRQPPYVKMGWGLKAEEFQGGESSTRRES